jgi:hypothetical protein
MNQLAPIITATRLPALIAAAGDRAGVRFLEFFAANIRNPNTRRAYSRAVGDFLAWCEDAGVPSIAAVQPLGFVTGTAAWVERGQRRYPSHSRGLPAAFRYPIHW